MPFKLYPLNKSTSGSYSFFQSSPIVTFQWAANTSRLIDATSLYLCGKVKIMNRNGKQMPANRFDVNGSASNDVLGY